MNNSTEAVLQSETSSKLTKDLLTRLGLLGYQCITQSCEQYTTLRISPVDKCQKEKTVITELA